MFTYSLDDFRPHSGRVGNFHSFSACSYSLGWVWENNFFKLWHTISYFTQAKLYVSYYHNKSLILGKPCSRTIQWMNHNESFNWVIWISKKKKNNCCRCETGHMPLCTLACCSHTFPIPCMYVKCASLWVCMRQCTLHSLALVQSIFAFLLKQLIQSHMAWSSMRIFNILFLLKSFSLGLCLHGLPESWLF